MDLAPQELISLFWEEAARIYGDDYADHTICEYGGRGGWFYVSFPYQKGGRWVVNPLSKPMRRRELIALLDDLRGK